MRAKKSYGQHFLRYPAIAEKIALALDVDLTGGRVLEVGPGKGVLTTFLAEHFPKFQAVEADPDMVAYLRSHHPEWDDKIIRADFLKLDLSTLFEGKSFQLIGNFPYNISSQIVFRMIENRDQIPEMVGMFQREVGRRIVSGPGSKDYGIVSVLAQAWYDGEYLFTVDRESFQPPPRVQSGVIRLVRKSRTTLGCDEEKFIRIVKTAFGQRRKMMRNTLRQFSTDLIVLEDPVFKLRPEQLTVEEFIALTNKLFPVDS